MGACSFCHFAVWLLKILTLAITFKWQVIELSYFTLVFLIVRFFLGFKVKDGDLSRSNINVAFFKKKKNHLCDISVSQTQFVLSFSNQTSISESCLFCCLQMLSVWSSSKFNSLPNDKIVDWSKLKAFADDKLTHYQTTYFRLFQTKRVFRQRFQISRKWQKVI